MVAHGGSHNDTLCVAEIKEAMKGEEKLMGLYSKSLYKFVNGYNFVRCFYGKCPECGKRIFSVGDDVVGNKIKAKFVCDCGKKYREVVYSKDMKKYKYPQALTETIKDKKFGEIKVLKFKGKYYFISPNKIRSRSI